MNVNIDINQRIILEQDAIKPSKLSFLFSFPSASLMTTHQLTQIRKPSFPLFDNFQLVPYMVSTLNENIMTQNHLSLNSRAWLSRRNKRREKKELEICRLSSHTGRIVVASNGWEDETCKRSAGERERHDQENNFSRNFNETHYFNLKSHEDSRDCVLSHGTL